MKNNRVERKVGRERQMKTKTRERQTNETDCNGGSALRLHARVQEDCRHCRIKTSEIKPVSIQHSTTEENGGLRGRWQESKSLCDLHCSELTCQKCWIKKEKTNTSPVFLSRLVCNVMWVNWNAVKHPFGGIMYDMLNGQHLQKMIYPYLFTCVM